VQLSGATAFVLTAGVVAAVAAPAAQAQGTWAPGEGRVQLSTLHYQDWQPALERVKVSKPALALDFAAGDSWQLQATALVDTISGASPAYHNVAGSAVRFADRRKAGDARVTWVGARTRLGLGLAHSDEADYRSDTRSLHGQWDSADRNVTLSLGASRSDDTVMPVNRPGTARAKRVDEWLLGVTRVLTPADLVQLNLTRTTGRGYLSDPYKLLDLRPDHRRQTTLLARWHRQQGETTWRLHARINDDSYGLRAGSAGAEWALPWRHGLTFTPSLRLYRQTAASFYRPPDPARPPGALPIPPGFEPGRTLFSLDPRLGAFTAWTGGLKVAWNFAPGWTAEVKGEAYRQTRTPTPLHARWWQFGLARDF
jgi:hypothetical protein